MAQALPPSTTYSDTTLVKRTITDVVANMDPRDIPLIANLGGLDGASSKFRFVNGNNTTVEWAEDTLPALASTVTETVATADVTLTVADAYIFHVGDILLLGTENLWCSAVASATTLTVTRGLGATSPATAADDAVLTLIGNARLEGAEINFRGMTDKTTNYNYSQIFHEGVKVARSVKSAMPQYGIADEMEYQSEKLIPHMLREIERFTFNNAGGRLVGAAGTPRVMGGLPTYITNNTVNYSTSFTQANVEDLLELIFLDGGLGPWVLPVDTIQMQAAKNLLDNTSLLRVQRGETTVGMVVKRYETPFGDVDLLLDRWSGADNFYAIDPTHAGFVTLYPFTMTPKASTGDYEQAEVIGEFSFCCRLDKAHGALT